MSSVLLPLPRRSIYVEHLPSLNKVTPSKIFQALVFFCLLTIPADVCTDVVCVAGRDFDVLYVDLHA